MNPEYLHALGTFVVTVACYMSFAMELISPNFNSMSPDELNATAAVYDEMVRLDPTNPASYAYRGCSLMAKKEFDKALADFDSVIRLAPDSPQGYAHRAAVWFEQNRLEQALNDYNEVVRLAPNFARSYRNRGQVLHRQGKLDQAKDDLDEAIRLDPDNSYGFAYRGRVYTDKHELVQALADFDEAIRLNPQNESAYCYRGIYWSQQNELDQAIRDFDAAINLKPPHAESYRCRGHAWQLKREYERAVSDFTEALLIKPDDATTYAWRGAAWASLHRLDEAIADFTEVLRLNPRDAEMFYRRSRVYGMKQEFDTAVTEIDQAIRIEPKRAAYHSYRGWLHHSRRELTQAAFDFTEAINLDPNNAHTYCLRSNVFSSQQEYGRALLDALAANDLNPRMASTESIELIASFVIHQRIEDQNDEPEDHARVALAYRARGVAYHFLEQEDRAIANLDRSIQFDPSSSKSFALRGKIWLQQHECDRALDDFNEALRLDPNDASVWLARGDAYSEQQAWTKARSDFSEAIRLDPRQILAFALRGITWQAEQEWDHAIADYDRTTSGGPLYVRAPRRRWHEQQSPPSRNKAKDNSVSTADFQSEFNSKLTTELVSGSNSEFDYASAIQTIIDSTKENYSPIFKSSNADEALNPKSDSPPKSHRSETNWGSNAPQPTESPTVFVGASDNNHVQLDPVYIEAHRHRAECQEAKREWDKALADYQELIHLAPNDSLAYCRTAWLKATCPDDAYRNGEEAVQFATQALERTRTPEPDHFATLAAAYAESGDFEKAVEYQSEAGEWAIKSCEKELQTGRLHFKTLEFSSAIDKNNDGPEPENAQTVESATEACERSAWQNVKLIENLANACAHTGQFEQAYVFQQKAHELKIELRGKPILNRLELYRAGKPYRDERRTN